ncbi:MAG: class I SAM-dependent methyltransferase, partial [Planctomycetota bacterium]
SAAGDGSSIGEQAREGFARVIRDAVLLYPNERVVAFLATHFGDRASNAGKQFLDVGCGSGRHMSVAMDYGLTAHGIDYAEEACVVARKNLHGRELLGEIAACDIGATPFQPGTFDAAVAWGALFYKPIQELRDDIGRLCDLMAPGGRLIADFRTRDNWFAKHGEPEGEGAVRLNEQAGPYRGLLYVFCDEEEAAGHLEAGGFHVDDVQRAELFKNGLAHRHSWWIFQASKPGASA